AVAPAAVKSRSDSSCSELTPTGQRSVPRARPPPESFQSHLKMCSDEHWKVAHAFVFVRSMPSMTAEQLAIARQDKRSGDGRWIRCGRDSKVWSLADLGQPDWLTPTKDVRPLPAGLHGTQHRGKARSLEYKEQRLDMRSSSPGESQDRQPSDGSDDLCDDLQEELPANPRGRHDIGVAITHQSPPLVGEGSGSDSGGSVWEGGMSPTAGQNESGGAIHYDGRPKSAALRSQASRRGSTIISTGFMSAIAQSAIETEAMSFNIYSDQWANVPQVIRIGMFSAHVKLEKAGKESADMKNNLENAQTSLKLLARRQVEWHQAMEDKLSRKSLKLKKQRAAPASVESPSRNGNYPTSPAKYVHTPGSGPRATEPGHRSVPSRSSSKEIPALSPSGSGSDESDDDSLSKEDRARLERIVPMERKLGENSATITVLAEANRKSQAHLSASMAQLEDIWHRMEKELSNEALGDICSKVLSIQLPLMLERFRETLPVAAPVENKLAAKETLKVLQLTQDVDKLQDQLATLQEQVDGLQEQHDEMVADSDGSSDDSSVSPSLSPEADGAPSTMLARLLSHRTGAKVDEGVEVKGGYIPVGGDEEVDVLQDGPGTVEVDVLQNWLGTAEEHQMPEIPELVENAAAEEQAEHVLSCRSSRSSLRLSPAHTEGPGTEGPGTPRQERNAQLEPTIPHILRRASLAFRRTGKRASSRRSSIAGGSQESSMQRRARRSSNVSNASNATALLKEGSRNSGHADADYSKLTSEVGELRRSLDEQKGQALGVNSELLRLKESVAKITGEFHLDASTTQAKVFETDRLQAWMDKRLGSLEAFAKQLVTLLQRLGFVSPSCCVSTTGRPVPPLCAGGLVWRDMLLSSPASSPSLPSRAARRRARLKRTAVLGSHVATHDLLGVLHGSAINSLLTSLSPSPCYGDSMLAPGSIRGMWRLLPLSLGLLSTPAKRRQAFLAAVAHDYLALRFLRTTFPCALKLLHPASSEGEELSPEDTFTRPERALQRIFGEAFEPPASSAGASMTQEFHDPFANETVASHDGFGAAIPLPTSEEEEEFCPEDTSAHPERALQRIIGEAFSDLLSEEDIYGLLQPLFRPFGDGDGLLSVQEIEDALLTIGICPVPQCWQIIMDDMDVGRSGNIDYAEFLAATIEARSFRVEEVLCSVFDVCDPSGEGKINMNDFKSIFEQNGLPTLLGSRTSQAIMKVVMKEVVLEAIEFFDLVRLALFLRGPLWICTDLYLRFAQVDMDAKNHAHCLLMADDGYSLSDIAARVHKRDQVIKSTLSKLRGSISIVGPEHGLTRKAFAVLLPVRYTGADIGRMPWPARSPDLTPIENSFALLEKQLRATQPLQESFTKFSARAMRLYRQIDSKRMQQVIALKGKMLEYCGLERRPSIVSVGRLERSLSTYRFMSLIQKPS
ncbi:unnamed protein product, partial [Polarella glacialis]